MLTRCPTCETHFRVTAEQLKARSGRVRCGECQHVFNALDTLIEEPMLVPMSVPREAPRPPNFPPSLSDIDQETAEHSAVGMAGALAPLSPSSEPVAETVAELYSLRAAEQGPLTRQADESAEPEPSQALATEPDTTQPKIAPAEASDWSETFPESPPPPRRWPWVIGSLVALVAIALQGVIAFRVELAVLWPESKPALVALCDVADCEVGLPARVALVGIEASDLHPDSAHPGRLTLTATLKNRAPFAQQFPHLELTLTDTADKAVARKVLAPADYLPQKTSMPQGMQPGADLSVAVGIDPGDVAASGYRLYVFYP